MAYLPDAIDMARNIKNNNYPSLELKKIKGYTPASGSSTRVLWEQGTVFTYMSIAVKLYISSTNANDTQIISYTALDSLYNKVNGTIQLNGQTPTLISNTEFIRILHASTPTITAGNINIYVDSTVTDGEPVATDLRARILANNLETMASTYTTPKGYSAMILNITCLTYLNGLSYFIPRIRYFGKEFEVLDRIILSNATASGCLCFSKNFYKFKPLILPEKTDIDLAVEGSNTAIHRGLIDLLLIEN